MGLYVSAFYMKCSSPYFLVHATNHPKGLEAMTEAMWHTTNRSPGDFGVGYDEKVRRNCSDFLLSVMFAQRPAVRSEDDKSKEIQIISQRVYSQFMGSRVTLQQVCLFLQTDLGVPYRASVMEALRDSDPPRLKSIDRRETSRSDFMHDEDLFISFASDGDPAPPCPFSTEGGVREEVLAAVAVAAADEKDQPLTCKRLYSHLITRTHAGWSRCRSQKHRKRLPRLAFKKVLKDSRKTGHIELLNNDAAQEPAAAAAVDDSWIVRAAAPR